MSDFRQLWQLPFHGEGLGAPVSSRAQKGLVLCDEIGFRFSAKCCDCRCFALLLMLWLVVVGDVAVIVTSCRCLCGVVAVVVVGNTKIMILTTEIRGHLALSDTSEAVGDDDFIPQLSVSTTKPLRQRLSYLGLLALASGPGGRNPT